MRGSRPILAMLGLLGAVATAAAEPAGTVGRPARLDLRSPGAAVDGGSTEDGILRASDPPGEVTWRLDGLALGMREEDGRLKGDLFVERGSWRLGVRPTTGGGALATDGIMLRFSTRLD